jgi:putative glutamine amidotransferase
MRPLIGVLTSERHAGALATLQRCDEVAPERELRLGTPYLRAIEAAGGLPVVLAPDDPEIAIALLDRLDGVVLAGGPDFDPFAYGAGERHARLGPTDPVIDAAELALARAADERGLPLLGVCRGLQAINVARGGTLHQHVADHRQAGAASETVHTVAVAPGSKLAALTGGGTLAVNSFHHQAAADLGSGLRAVAAAPDGTVEGLEDPARPFVVGVQWHAEALVARPAQLALFEGLVAAASGTRLALAA